MGKSLTEREYYLAFSATPGVGPKSFIKLLNHFGAAEKAWNASVKDLSPILKPALTSKFDKSRKEFDFESHLKRLTSLKISWVCQFEKSYPELLKEIPDAPII